MRPHAVTAVGSDVYAYDGNGNLTSRTGKALTWNVDNTVASAVGPDNIPEGYTYDAGGSRVTRSRNLGQTGGFTTVYIGGLYEEDAPSGDKRLAYTFAGKVIAQRAIPGSGGTGTLVYLHGDHLGSVSATTSSAGAWTSQQLFNPFGEVRASDLTATKRNFTGQYRDDTGLLFYHARYYDPALARFASADSIVPGAASGAGGAAATLGPDGRAALRPLAVDFREPGFAKGLAEENQFTQAKGFAFQLSDEDKRRAKDGAGPQNPQALNRYAYVLNNPVRYTDPTGHASLDCGWQSGIYHCKAHFTYDETKLLLAAIGVANSVASPGVIELVAKLFGVVPGDWRVKTLAAILLVLPVEVFLWAIANGFGISVHAWWCFYCFFPFNFGYVYWPEADDPSAAYVRKGGGGCVECESSTWIPWVVPLSNPWISQVDPQWPRGPSTGATDQAMP